MKFRWMVLLCLVAALAVSLWIYYWAASNRINESFSPPPFKDGVALRQLPYPCRAAVGLTISPGQGLALESYLNILTLLNTKRETPLGQGLNLEVGGSFYFHAPADNWPEFFGPVPTPHQRERIKKALEEGWLESLDSFGAKDDFTRDDAGAALAALLSQGLRPKVWADRFDSPDDLNPARGRGDHPGKSTYHLDLSLDAGIEFFFLGRKTSILGQNAPVEVAAPVCRTQNRNFLVRWWLNTMARLNHIGLILTESSGDIIRDNRLLGPVRFKDTNPALEFSRFGRPSQGQNLPLWLAESCLDELIGKGGRIAVAQIIGAEDTGLTPDNFIKYLTGLIKRVEDRQILLTTTSRLLTYTRMNEELIWESKADQGDIEIHLKSRKSLIKEGEEAISKIKAENLAGLTFYVPEADRARLYLNGEEIWVRRNLMDHTGRESISVPWQSGRRPKPAN